MVRLLPVLCECLSVCVHVHACVCVYVCSAHSDVYMHVYKIEIYVTHKYSKSVVHVKVNL